MVHVILIHSVLFVIIVLMKRSSGRRGIFFDSIYLVVQAMYGKGLSYLNPDDMSLS